MIFAVSLTQPANYSVALASTHLWSLRCKTVQTETCAWVGQEFCHQLLYVNAVNLLLVKIAHCNRVEADFRHRSPQARFQSPRALKLRSACAERTDAELLASVASASQLMMSQATNSINYQIQWQQTPSAKFAYKHANSLTTRFRVSMCTTLRSSLSTQKYKPKVGGQITLLSPLAQILGGTRPPSPPVIYGTG